jgi:cleavage and polyadenylation specificity factor subunit 1
MRCACMLIYGFKLVIIPFYEDHSSLNNNHQFNLDEKAYQDGEESSKLNSDNFKSESSNLHETSFVHKSEKTTNNQSSITSLSSYTIDLRKLDNWLEMRIVDIEFLYGYYEPTLFILSESNMTWVGRYAVKKDTCNSVALSINLNQKTHPIIWPVDKLPSDCLKCLAVPLPIGGVLLFAVNSLIYINQSVPSYGISLNSIAQTTSNYPFKNMEYVRITLDNSQAVFIGSNQLFVSLKGGEIYIITMLTDFESLRTVRNFNIEKGPGSVISSCLVKCADNFLFIGSRLANSVLLKYNIKLNSHVPQTTSSVQKELNSIEETVKQREKSISLDVGKNDDIINDMLDYQELMLNQEQKVKETLVEQQQQKSEQDDLDRILDINQSKTQNQADIASYTFEICDILLNIAPCGFSIVSESPGDHSEFEQNSIPYHIDLVTSSGYTKNGAISVLQRSLRPEIITSFEIPDIVDMWSVSNETDSQSPTFLFLTKTDSTIVLQMGNEITELDKENSIFCTRLATICCANLSNSKFIIQITTNDLFIYADCSTLDAKLAFSLDISSLIDSKLKYACVCDPYVVVLCENGVILLFLFDETSITLKLISNSVKSSSFEQEDQSVFGLYTSVTLYKDESGIFSVEQESKKDDENLDDEEMETSIRNESSNYASPSSKKLKTDSNTSGKKKKINERLIDEMNIDDEDELLYGSSNIQVGDSNSSYISKLLADSKTAFNNNMNNKSFTGEGAEQQANFQQKTKYIRQVSYWLVGASHPDGNLTFFQLNEDKITPMYVLYKFNSASKTVTMNTTSLMGINQDKTNTTFFRQASMISSNQPHNFQIEEISLIATGLDRARTLLLAKIDEDLLIYEAFLAFDENQQSDLRTNRNRYRLSFKRLNHEIVIRDKKKRKKNVTEKRENTELDDDLERNLFNIRTSYTPCFRSFSNIAGYNGFFVSGLNSYLCFMCPRSGLVAHPLWIDGSILSFTPFTNASITLSGFIYMNKSFNIRICNLPTEDTQGKQQIHYDSNWILKKIQLRQTVHFICYHEESKTFAVVTSTSEPTNKLMQLGGEDKEMETFERDENFILPHKSQFYLQLYTPNTWEQLPLGKYTMAEWEHVSSLKLVNLPYEGHSSGFRTYLAASTVNCYNEDVNSRGRIILFDIIEAVPEPDKPLTSIKMKVVFEKEQKGPVSCLESVNGYLIGGVGQKVSESFNS